MTHEPLSAAPPADDTPVDERPPYDEPSYWPIFLAAAFVVGLVLALAVAAALVARGAWRLFTRPRARPERLIMFPAPDQPYVGPLYRVEFYDDQYRQLTDRDLRVALPALHGPAADTALDTFARQCAAEVETRDSQRCFRPRLVVYGVDGRVVRSWQVAA